MAFRGAVFDRGKVASCFGVPATLAPCNLASGMTVVEDFVNRRGNGHDC